MRLSRQLRELIFSIAIGPVMIVIGLLAYVNAEKIDEVFGRIVKFLILGK